MPRCTKRVRNCCRRRRPLKARDELPKPGSCGLACNARFSRRRSDSCHPGKPPHRTLQCELERSFRWREADFSLEGVLRSEISDSLRHHLRSPQNECAREHPCCLSLCSSSPNPGYYTRRRHCLRDLLREREDPLEGRPQQSDDQAIGERSGMHQIFGLRSLTGCRSTDSIARRRRDFVPNREDSASEPLRGYSATTALIFAIMQLSR